MYKENKLNLKMEPTIKVKNVSLNYEIENAAERWSHIGYIFKQGKKQVKKNVLESLDEKYSNLHKDGYIHIHDLDAYGLTYNCLQMDVLQTFPYEEFKKYSTYKQIASIFSYFQNIISKIGNEQSGGMGFPNFDCEISTIFKTLNIPYNDITKEILKTHIELLMDWINDSHERAGEVSYYVTFNLGLCTDEIARFVTRSVISHFKETDIIRPNIIFKIKSGVNYLTSDPNHDLYQLSLSSSAKKMIPTYILFDSKVNSSYDPKKVAIMGCRTKVVDDIYGEQRSIGRVNIDYITINLPRIALEVVRDYQNVDKNERIKYFKEKFYNIALSVRDILLDRYHKLLKLDKSKFPSNLRFKLQLNDFDTENLENIFKHGTLSVGFIGLSEAIKVLTNEEYYTENNHTIALDIVSYMKSVVDEFKNNEKLNFTLLASSGEYISGRFPEIDKKYFNHEILEKEFYTNSFHVEVTKKINPIEKIEFEGPFHQYTNGGSISYLEFSSAPLSNIEALEEIVDTAIKSGVNYLGVNFPLDRCKDCNETGTFDNCPNCGSHNILRIRRVSGYLETLDTFVKGKRKEEENRVAHFCINKVNGYGE